MITWLMLLGVCICLTTFFIGLTAYSIYQKQAAGRLIIVCLVGLGLTVITAFFYYHALIHL
ncbi:hypothetical protein GKC32_04255 [Lactobacillus curvatus]|uniref:hypothetical protein n=1 Tax=Latilactobacillus fragifolii TaxID=2814244 RepID=UPI0012AF615B|nr:hypothetical protein [Latilactobacillus fragifolii]MSD83498.1 hypothetical protein [Latilactobacillus curvatus]MSE23689.1 hypothetical protein [Latilactobacillus curvatus]